VQGAAHAVNHEPAQQKCCYSCCIWFQLQLTAKLYCFIFNSALHHCLCGKLASALLCLPVMLAWVLRVGCWVFAGNESMKYNRVSANFGC